MGRREREGQEREWEEIQCLKMFICISIHVKIHNYSYTSEKTTDHGALQIVQRVMET